MHEITVLLCFLFFEYCCLNWFCKPCQSTFIGLRDSYHNLASPTSVRQSLWTFTPSWNWWVSIQSFVLSWCASASSSVFPENSGLKCDQLIAVHVMLVVQVVAVLEGLEVLGQLVLVVLNLPYLFYGTALVIFCMFLIYLFYFFTLGQFQMQKVLRDKTDKYVVRI